MSDAASATPKKTKKAAKPKKASTHPKYIDMVVTAIKNLGERSGSSRQAISKYITENYKVGDNIKSQLKMCLKRGVDSGVLVRAKGTGASGSFKVASDKPAKKPASKAVKKSTPAKAKKAKTPTKKTAVKKTPKKKPAAKVAKKTPVKKAKAAPKKKTPKKAAKAKKPAKK